MVVLTSLRSAGVTARSTSMEHPGRSEEPVSRCFSRSCPPRLHPGPRTDPRRSLPSRAPRAWPSRVCPTDPWRIQENPSR
jgi:hypothetical protein